jgi:hypothetical protein
MKSLENNTAMLILDDQMSLMQPRKDSAATRWDLPMDNPT